MLVFLNYAKNYASTIYQSLQGTKEVTEEKIQRKVGG